VQLGNYHTEPNNDQAANGSRRSGTDKGVSEAEFVDRNAKSDHHDAHHDGSGANAIQQTRHTRSSTEPPISSFGA